MRNPAKCEMILRIGLLLDAGASKSVRWRGRTSPQWAKHCGRMQILLLFRTGPSLARGLVAQSHPDVSSADKISADALDTGLRPYSRTMHTRRTLDLDDLNALSVQHASLADMMYYIRIYLAGETHLDALRAVPTPLSQVGHTHVHAMYSFMSMCRYHVASPSVLAERLDARAHLRTS